MVSNDEIRMIQMLTENIFPGAVEARAYEFIFRDMKSNPFLVELYRKGLKQLNEGAEHLYQKQLLQLNSNQLTGLLVRHEKSTFFKFLRDHTLEGIFSDPIYGGNYEAYGWRLLGYAGPTFHPPETIREAKHPMIYYSLEGIAYEKKA